MTSIGVTRYTPRDGCLVIASKLTTRLIVCGQVFHYSDVRKFNSPLRFLTFQILGENRGSPRIWLESRRLEPLGFKAGTKFSVETLKEGIRIHASASGTHTVSKRRHAGGTRPIIDLTNRSFLSPLSRWEEVKIAAFPKRIDVTPSIRAFAIRKHRVSRSPWQTIEIFSGGGTLSGAITSHPDFNLIAGIEIDPRYADVWESKHREALLIQADLRRIHPSELPPHEILVAAIPCTSHSTLGRAKKALRQKPELGESGDLFMSLSSVVATHVPLACVFENVTSFGSSLAGSVLRHHLRQLGYHVFETILDPHGEWNEPQDRRRWLMIATLQPGFELKVPEIPFTGDLSKIIDPATEKDNGDALRIAGSLKALIRHRDRHKKLGHGFGFTTINQQSTRVPTIVRSYHKINIGPFVDTAFGPRLLRKHEVEKLMGCRIICDHYATAIEILGQGVQTKIFHAVLSQLARFLRQNYDRD